MVIALGALLCAIGWAISWGDDAQELYRVKYQVISGFKNPSCSSMIQMLAGGKLSPEPGYDNPCWELYRYRSIYKSAAQTEEGYIKHMNSTRREFILQMIGLALIMWLVGVALLYGAGLVVAWVVRGFRSRE